MMPAATVAAGLLILTACGGAAPRSPGGLTAFHGCGALLAGLRSATAAHVTPYGLEGAPVMPPLPVPRLPDSVTPPAPPSAGGGFSATNVQEPGVDEPDLVKTDGRRIVTVAGGRLHVVDVASRRQTGTLDLRARPYGLPGTVDLLMHGDRVLVIGRALPRSLPVAPGGPAAPVPQQGPRLILVDVSGPPRVVASLQADGSYVDARQTGSVVRLVVRSVPAIRFPARSGTAPAQAVAANRAAVRHAPLDAWLPHYTLARGATTRRLTLPCERLAHPPSYTGTSVLSVLTLDLSGDLGDPAPMGVLAAGDTVYGTAHTLYVADRPGPAVPSANGTPARPATTIYRFDLHGGARPRFTASGSVPGEPLGAYALSEYSGYLRVATTSTAAPPPAAGPPAVRRPGADGPTAGPRIGSPAGGSPAEGGPPAGVGIAAAIGHRLGSAGDGPAADGMTSLAPAAGDDTSPTLLAGGTPAPAATESAVYVLARHGDRLERVGAIGGLGRGERIQAVRFIGPAGYVATFRRTDPLYVLDLRDPRRPRVTGQLTISGYSAYLHPVGDGLLLGVGQSTGAAAGAAATLFDVRDPAAPRRVGGVALPGGAAAAEYDPHAFLYVPSTGLTVLPVGGPGGDRAVALSVTPTGVRTTGELRVPGDAGGIERVLLADGVLWTLYPDGTEANDPTTLARIATLSFGS